MTAVVDTSLWIPLFRDKSGGIAKLIEAAAGQARIVMLPPIRMELLQGCRGEPQWRSMQSRVDAFELLPMPTAAWDAAARIHFDLRQAGVTVRSALDCCIAQICLDHDAVLLHNDGDFEIIAKVRPLKHLAPSGRSSLSIVDHRHS